LNQHFRSWTWNRNFKKITSGIGVGIKNKKKIGVGVGIGIKKLDSAVLYLRGSTGKILKK
jgi:hypothetical protein